MEDQHICLWNLCESRFESEKDLFLHIEKQHLQKLCFSNSSGQPCLWKECAFKTTTRFRLKTHLKCHVPFRSYECPVADCGYSFKVILINTAQTKFKPTRFCQSRNKPKRFKNI
eukprot:NODE_43_length_33755_cov_1.178542.p35 type:complete len:114 gc:universal NODE_43_length_33755_cov_1.178542:22829-22488(-)